MNLTAVPPKLPGEEEGAYVNRVITIVQTTITVESTTMPPSGETTGDGRLEGEILHILGESGPLTNQAVTKLVHQRQLIKKVRKQDVNRCLHSLRSKSLLSYEEVGSNKVWKLVK
jgi:hypothetical protein